MKNICSYSKYIMETSDFLSLSRSFLCSLTLFTHPRKLKNGKAELYNDFTTYDGQELTGTKPFVADGGYLLHDVKRKKKKCNFYHYICMQHVNYSKNNFVYSKTHVEVLFHCYDAPGSMK